MNRWPVQECLHEHATDEERVVNMVGQVVRIIPRYCHDCGHALVDNG